MKLITRCELPSTLKSVLHALHHEALKTFSRAARGTQELRDAVASLANLQAEIGSWPEP